MVDDGEEVVQFVGLHLHKVRSDRGTLRMEVESVGGGLCVRFKCNYSIYYAGVLQRRPLNYSMRPVLHSYGMPEEWKSPAGHYLVVYSVRASAHNT